VFYEHVGNICRKRFIFGGEDVEHGIHAWKRGQRFIFCAMFVSEISVSNDDYLSNVHLTYCLILSAAGSRSCV
jgi:hypothetical protein